MNKYLSLRAPAGSVAIAVLLGKYEIASVVKLPRKDMVKYIKE